ncbi:fibronectin type III domain-containing protein, partial [Winogradskyella sp.]|uniref:fibronectin type III domain-containing protein n=2 Tax=Winogradskyella TaxID=286104 RepID=UPI003AA83893
MKKITLFLFMFSLLAFSGLEAQITTFPYTEDFESGDGGWVADNTGNGTWALGTPAGTIINSAASGDNSWVTNLTGTYNVNEDSWVTSPIFDFSSLSAPSIELSIWYDAEFSYDGAVLQSSIDGGVTWVNVGANGDSNNWFNDGTINGDPGDQQEGWSGTGTAGTNAWVTARHTLTDLAGETSVIFRIAFGSDGSVVDDGFGFDDINIFEVTCSEPNTLTASNVNSSGAELSWTESGSSSDWNIEVVTSGTPPTGTPSESNVSNPYTASGLSAVTSYDFYVQSNCGGESSSWVGPYTFTTTCDVYTPDYLEQFDTIIPDCWDEADSGDATTGPG